MTGAAAYGYIPMEDAVEEWQADFIFYHPRDINNLLDQ